jgi:hypothetical protein
VPQGTTVYERTAYNFAKWTYTTTAGTSADIAAAGANVAVANFKITWTGTSADGTLAGTATIVANWTPYTYTIAWDHNYTGRPTPTTTNNVKPTDTITQPANPTRRLRLQGLEDRRQRHGQHRRHRQLRGLHLDAREPAQRRDPHRLRAVGGEEGPDPRLR